MVRRISTVFFFFFIRLTLIFSCTGVSQSFGTRHSVYLKPVNEKSIAMSFKVPAGINILNRIPLLRSLTVQQKTLG